MAVVLIAVVAAIVLALRERSWRRTVAALRAERDHTRAGLHDLSGLARDLRSPLQGVIGNTELMMASAEATAPNEELRDIRDNAARAADIVRTIAVVAETSALARRWQDLNDVVAHALGARRLALTAAGVRVAFERAERLPLVYVDGRQLERVLTTLLGADAARPLIRRHRNATLRTGARRGDEQLVVEYEDPSSDGVVPPGDLAACRHVVEAHGGTLAVERPDGGFRFVLELPVWTT